MSLNQDIGTAAGFSQLTSGSITDLANVLGFNPADWDIREASYRGGSALPSTKEVKFHVFKNKGPFTSNQSTPWNGALPRISDTGGRRKIKYEYPYVDGQTTDDLGRRPGSFELEILIFGQNYMKCYEQLMEQFDDPVPGVLIHPVRGEIACGVDQFTLTHQSDQRKAMSIHVTFIEHNYSIVSTNDLAEKSSNNIKAALSAVLEVFTVIDVAINKVNAALLLKRGIRAIVSSYLALFKTNAAQTVAKMNATFNTKGGSSDIPSLIPVNIGGIAQPPITTTTGAKVSTLAVDGSTTAAAAALSKAFGNKDPKITKSTPPPVTTSKNFPLVTSLTDPLSGASVVKNINASATPASQLSKEVAGLTAQVAAIISSIEDNGGALELYDTVLGLRQSISDIQAVLTAGIQSSRVRLNTYVTPRVMSIREVCFQNGISLSRISDVILLNLSLLSVNYIEKDTILMVPAS